MIVDQGGQKNRNGKTTTVQEMHAATTGTFLHWLSIMEFLVLQWVVMHSLALTIAAAQMHKVLLGSL